MEAVRDVWVDTSRPGMPVLCLGPLGTFNLREAAEGVKQVAEVPIVLGQPRTRSNRRRREGEVDARFMYVMGLLPAELLEHTLPLIREGYRIV